jgi:hypothetical protein
MLEASHVIGMCMGDDDRVRTDPVEVSEPVLSAIHHDPLAPVGNKQGCVHPMPLRPRVDVAARAQERNLHRPLLIGSNAATEQNGERDRVAAPQHCQSPATPALTAPERHATAECLPRLASHRAYAAAVGPRTTRGSQTAAKVSVMPSGLTSRVAGTCSRTASRARSLIERIPTSGPSLATTGRRRT